MMHNIDDAIVSLAVDINKLNGLENNARRGNVDAIKASYNKFGQLKPIVAVREDSGKLTVIAGNHQLEAAKQLGWDAIAVSIVDLEHDDALAFALADNRISDMGSTDTELLYDMLTQVLGDDEDFFDVLGWDDFSVAAIENTVIESEFSNDSNSGWTAPEIVVNEISPTPSIPASSTNAEVSKPITAPDASSVPAQTIVTQGSTSTSSSGVSNASIQFTLVFDSSEQQSKWYSFLKWLKENPAYDGDTTSERLLDFIAQHSPRG